jgi:tripartite-type tricarboxylate transporter receptor subunit TctC
VRLLAVTAAERHPLWPDLPTFRELGFAPLVASTWFGVSGPAGLPDAIADRLNAEVVAALATPGIAPRLAEIGASASRMTRAAYTAFVAAEIARWAEVVRVSGARVD